MSFDINDATTWPNDSDELLKLANDPALLGNADVGAATYSEEEDEEAPAEAPKDETPAAAADKADSKTMEDAKTDETEPEAEKAETKTEPPADEPEPVVLAADGKHTLPYSVLRGLRDEVQRLKGELAGRDKPADPPAVASPPAADPAPATDTLPAEVTAKIDDLREKWGDEVAEMYRDQFKLKRQLEDQSRALQDVNSARERDSAAAARNEEEQIQTAIDSAPVLAAWQADTGNPEWYQRAVKMNEFLLQNDTEYARKSWGERMQALPTKVHALYGDSPHASQTKPASGMPAAISNADVQKQAEAKVQQATSKPPTTLSDIKGGQTADVNSDDPVAQAEGMTVQQIRAHMQKLSDDPAKLAAYLAKFS